MNNDIVIIQLDRPRVLKFSHTALKTLVEMTGKTIEQIDGQLDLSNFEQIEQLVYCGVLKDARDNNESLTLQQIPDLLDYAPKHVHVLEKVVAAWRSAFGAEQQAEGNVPQPAEIPAKRNRSTGEKASE